MLIPYMPPALPSQAFLWLSLLCLRRLSPLAACPSQNTADLPLWKFPMPFPSMCSILTPYCWRTTARWPIPIPCLQLIWRWNPWSSMHSCCISQEYSADPRSSPLSRWKTSTRSEDSSAWRAVIPQTSALTQRKASPAAIPAEADATAIRGTAPYLPTWWRRLPGRCCSS